MLGLVAAAFACAAGAAKADVAAVANDGTTPFDGGGAVTSPLEQVAAQIASTVAGRPVSVRCESDDDWPAIASSHHFLPQRVLGFVSFLDGAPADFAELSPTVCRSLQAFAGAATKPTKCASRSEARTTTKTIRKKIVRTLKGKRIVTWRTRTIRQTTYVDVPQPIGACFADGRELVRDSAFWDTYFETAQALQTLVHEAVHLGGNDVEAEAECYGMQWLSYAAEQLGDTSDDAAAITAYYVTRLYPARQSQSPAYWSAECKADGALDLTPNDGVWP